MRHLTVVLSAVCLMLSACTEKAAPTPQDAGNESPTVDSSTGGGTDASGGSDASIESDSGISTGVGDSSVAMGDCTPAAKRDCGPKVKGACVRGSQTCGEDGTWGECKGAVDAVAETCDTLDNDCDGKTDENVLTTFYRDVDGDTFGGAETQTACVDPDAASAEWIAVGGDCDDTAELVFPGTTEVCDGIDNDCANGVDDGFAPVPADNVAGACSLNVKICDGANGIVDAPTNYVPISEACDGIDNDCANGVDDGVGRAAANVEGACSANVQVCDVTGNYVDDVNNYVPVAETCDGIDNDCANGVDDGMDAIDAANVEGACSENTQVCDGVNGYVDDEDNYEPIAEVCDGVDNDCKDGIDDGLGELPSSNTAGACANNVRFCYGANGYVEKASNYEPVAETCDGVDNDCANGIDDGMTPIAAANTQGACSTNTQVCDGTNGYVNRSSNYVPTAETCDGIDNDCANGVDDGMAPLAATNVQGACSANTRICSGAGGYVNSPSNYVPVAETCDGIDNDCTNGVDDGLGSLAAVNVQGACSGNTRICFGVSGYVNSPTNYVPIAETCDGIDNDCANGIDNGLPELPADNLVGACAGNKKICGGVSGYINKPTNFVPLLSDTTCNALDDDCSGAADEDYVPNTSCFLPGLCAPGNVASSCSPTMETPCQSTAPAFAVDQCAGKDDNCDGLVDQCWKQLNPSPGSTCNGCRKDLFAGRYVYCDGFYAGSYKTNCDFNGNNCTFPPIQSTTKLQCETLCQNEPGCKFYTYYSNGSICNLHLMAACTQESAQFSGIIYYKGGCTPTATNDVTCDGNDDDCNGEVDEDFVADTSCFKTGACAATNQGSSCVFGQVKACKAGTPTSATDTTCNGVDDDCSGTADEDWVADSSCFKQGVCAAGNDASKCNAGVLTACKTTAPTTTEDLCMGADNNCDGSVDTVCYNKLTNNEQKTCGGCYKDMFAGRYVYCNGYYPKATKTGCDWDGTNCTFPADKAVTATECKQLCKDEPGCYFATSYYDSICNLHLMTECTQNSSGASGTIYQKQVSCLPTATNDVTCNGVDDDCDGNKDEDWAASTSCFKQGVCAAGNVASSCSNGVLTACRTGTAAPQDLCAGQDNNCDGTVATTCFTQLTTNEQQTCTGCYKDMFAGNYVYCDGTYSGATRSDCDWVGGTGTCTFPADKTVTGLECQAMCEQEPGCYFFTNYYDSICNLHLMTSCTRQTSGAAGSIFKKNVSCIPTAASDTTCNGVDDDCSGTADEDWVADSSCFKSGVCAVGNAASKCTNGILTACKTGTPTSALDQCNGQDGNCDGTVETSCWTEVTQNQNFTCGGCRKDLYAGQFVYCDGTYDGATRDDCDWTGGPGTCTFPRQTSVTAEQCRDLCDAEPGCSHVTSYYDSICNLHMMTSCEQEASGAPGSIFASPDACVPIYEDDSSCDGVDDDCDGDIDEDYVRITSCFKPGACAAGNVASSCTNGSVTACTTGTAAAAEDLCMGNDDNCDGATDSVCFTQLTTNQAKTCSGCRKDMFAGAYIGCTSATVGATKTNCPSSTGGSGCTFAADSSVTQAECKALCKAEAGCYFLTSYDNSICNLHLMNTCTQVTADIPGSISRIDGCIPTAASDTTCNGVDEDCSGTADEDYVPKTTCYKQGVCAAGNVASKCALGVETACKTGTPTHTVDQCMNKDDNCDGLTECPTDTDKDGIPDATDSCGGDNASGNTDGDTICNDLDNCPGLANSNQADTDRDGIGNVCDKCPNAASTDQSDSDGDGIGNVCDPDNQLPPQGQVPGGTNNGGNPARPTCGFTPNCPNATNVNKYSKYLFACYSEEPNGGDLCLGDRWWYHLNRRIFPMMVGDQPASTTEGILEELERPEYNVAATSCASSSNCPSGAGCYDGVCLFPAVKNFIDRLANSSDFLSCTGSASYENTWPASRTVKLDAGPCGWQTFGWKSSYGYRIKNTLSEPMTVWIGRGAGSSTGDADKRWWTLYPNEEIKFNSYDVAYVMPTSASAYNACMPGFMARTIHTENLTPPSFTQVSPTPLVTYTVAGESGSFVIYRDKYLKTDFDLFEYPNYFGVGLGPKGTNGTKPLYGFMAVAVPPSVGARYPELTCF